MKIVARRRRWFIALISCTGVSLLAYGIGWTSLVSVHNISFSGSAQSIALQNQLAQSHQLAIAMPMARINVPHIKRTLLSNSWIKTIHISRDWLHGKVTVVIEERIPVAAYQSADKQMHFFDNDGKEFTSSYINAKLPIISFSSNSEILRLAAARILRAIPKELLDSLQGMKVRSLQFIDTTHQFDSGTKKIRNITIRWGNSENIALKIKVFQVLYNLKENVNAQLFDLSTPGTPITK